MIRPVRIPRRLARAASGLILLGVAACASAGGTTLPAAVVPRVEPELATPPDTATIAAADSVLVRFVTSKGDFDVMLRKEWAPLGAVRVGQVVASGYYDGARFFRALRGFVVQWGIPADTAQLFVNLRDNARLDATSFAPVGEVVRGMEVVDQLHTGYGEGAPAGQGPTQQRIGAEGEPYLAKDFPLLDRIIRARVVRVYGPAAR